MSSARNNKNSDKGSDKAWLQELKSNRKTQVALAVFLIVASYLGYQVFGPQGSSSANRLPSQARNIVGQPLDSDQLAAIQRLPNLAGLHKAGELPSESRMFRDLFGFDSPPPPPPPPPPPREPAPPRPPPTAEELAAQERRRLLDAERRRQPEDYQMIGILQGWTGPVKGAFKKGDDVEFLTIGDEASQNWKLVELNAEEAHFQNTVFDELTYTIRVQDASAGRSSGPQRRGTNLF